MELPPPWELKESTRYPGRCYYYNTETQESSWLRPIPYPGKSNYVWTPSKPPIIYVLHILIKFSDVDPSVQRTKEAAAEEITNIAWVLINGNTKFEEMARQKSEDLESRDKGGVIGNGWIKQDQEGIPNEFIQAAWKLRVGEMSPLVETEKGYHLILRRG